MADIDEKKILAELEARMTRDTTSVFMETGTLGIDLGLTNGKGLPLGDWISVVADPGTGKTTIFADSLRRTFKKFERAGVPFKAIYIDLEGSKELLVSMGLGKYIENGSLIYLPGQTTFGALDVLYKQVFMSGNPMYTDVRLIIIDSITGVISDKNAEKNCEADEFGNDAKALTKFLKKYVPLHEEKKITTVGICQVRQNQGAGMFEEKKKAAMVDSLKHYSSITAKLKKSTNKQDKDMKTVKQKTTEGVIDVQTRFMVTMSTYGSNKKNRHGKVPDVSMLVQPGKRVINEYTLRNMLVMRNYVSQSGAYFEVSKDLPIEDIKDKKYSTKELNDFMTKNYRTLIEFLKENNMYTASIDIEEEEDDEFEEDA